MGAETDRARDDEKIYHKRANFRTNGTYSVATRARF